MLIFLICFIDNLRSKHMKSTNNVYTISCRYDVIQCTMRCSYNAFRFLQYPYNKHPKRHGLFVISFNHGLPWCVKYMARGPPVTTKPDGEAGGLCGDRRPEGHVFHTSRQAMIKTYYSTSIRKNMVQNCSYFTQMKSTTTAIDDSNRRGNKLGLGCSREATAPLIMIFKLLFLWLNIGRHFKGIAQFHNCHSPKHTSKKFYLAINIFRKICTKIIT